MRAARADLGGRSVAGVLGITDDRLLRADLGTVTAARTAARTRGPSTARTDAPADPTAPDADLLAQALADEASGTTTVAEAVRAQLGWADPTAFAVSGTYLNAHLALLAGASTDGAGGIVLTTTETGGNAARAAGLRRPHFATDQAGRPVDPTVEAPMLADGRISPPKLIVALKLESSTSNARRVIEQGGVTIGPDRSPVSDPREPIAVEDGLIVRVGKRKIARVRLA